MRRFVWIFFISSIFFGCGYQDLPKMKTEAESALSEVMIQYRLRADLVPQFIKLVEGRRDQNWPKIIEQIRKSQGQAVGVDLPLNQLNEKQLNRVASFQHALSRDLHRFVADLEKDPRILKQSEFISAKEQLSRAENRIAEARGKYLTLAPSFNAKLNKIPHKWLNAWLYKFKPAPPIQ